MFLLTRENADGVATPYRGRDVSFRVEPTSNATVMPASASAGPDGTITVTVSVTGDYDGIVKLYARIVAEALEDPPTEILVVDEEDSSVACA
ncbi:MAG: hypothetical protein AB8B57_11140 [Congregibacter sp.]